MTRRAAGSATLLVLFASQTWAAPGQGISLSGFVGTGYLLSTDRHGSQSLFDLAGGLNIRGGLLDPGLLRWSAGATYWGNWGLGDLGPSTSNRVTFDAHLTALSKTAVTVTLGASRGYSDANSGGAAAQTSGTSATTTLGGSATFRLPTSPIVSAHIGRTVVDTAHPTAGAITFGSTNFGASVAQGLAGFDYSVSYDTGWNDGTYAEQNYRTDTVSARMSGALATSLKFNIYDAYYLRLPTNQSEGNPRFDTNMLGTNMQWLASPRLTASLGYSHQQALIADLGEEPVETRSQRLQQTLAYQILDSLQIRQSLSAEYGHAAIGVASRSGWGQSLGLGLLWQRPVKGVGLSAGVDGSAGLVEPDGGGLDVSYGAGASASITGNLSRASGTLAYSVGFSAGGPAVTGYTVQQAARAEASFRTSNASLLTALFSAHAGRREDAFLGTFINRALTARLRFSQQRIIAELTGGMTDGVSAALDAPGFGGGLLLPMGYNTQTNYLRLSVSSDFDNRRLGVRLAGNIGSTVSPYRPSEVGAGLTGIIWYTIGRFRVSVEDRLLFSGPSIGNSFNNQLMVRLSRDFSGEFLNQ